MPIVTETNVGEGKTLRLVIEIRAGILRLLIEIGIRAHNCSAWLKPKLNTKIGLHTHPIVRG